MKLADCGLKVNDYDMICCKYYIRFSLKSSWPFKNNILFYLQGSYAFFIFDFEPIDFIDWFYSFNQMIIFSSWNVNSPTYCIRWFSLMVLYFLAQIIFFSLKIMVLIIGVGMRWGRDFFISPLCPELQKYHYRAGKHGILLCSFLCVFCSCGGLPCHMSTWTCTSLCDAGCGLCLMSWHVMSQCVMVSPTCNSGRFQSYMLQLQIKEVFLVFLSEKEKYSKFAVILLQIQVQLPASHYPKGPHSIRSIQILWPPLFRGITSCLQVLMCMYLFVSVFYCLVLPFFVLLTKIPFVSGGSPSVSIWCFVLLQYLILALLRPGKTHQKCISIKPISNSML